MNEMSSFCSKFKFITNNCLFKKLDHVKARSDLILCFGPYSSWLCTVNPDFDSTQRD